MKFTFDQRVLISENPAKQAKQYGEKCHRSINLEKSSLRLSFHTADSLYVTRTLGECEMIPKNISVKVYYALTFVT